MIVSLHARTEAHVRIYFERTQDAEIRRMLPSAAKTVEDALAMFRHSQLPVATSYGRTIYVDGAYVGDVWCYGIQDDEPNAMLSYCIFDQSCWGRGAATEAVRLFVNEVQERLALKSMGAFTYADNIASNRVLEKNGFQLAEELEEDGRVSAYWTLTTPSAPSRKEP